ncbi:MAG: hypothetical protein WCS25_01965 [Victivallaceae bacterium]
MQKLWFVILFVVTTCITVTAQGTRIEFKNIKIKTEFLSAPVYKLDNFTSGLKSDKKWLMVNTSYRTPNIKAHQGNEWIDNIRVETEIIFSALFQGKPVWAYATGKTEYWAIELDGKDHRSMALLPPQVLHRYGDAKNYKNLKVYVRVSFYLSRNNLLLGRSVAGSRADAQLNSVFETISGPLGSALRLPNVIVPLEKSPWALIDVDYQEMLKPEEGK